MTQDQINKICAAFCEMCWHEPDTTGLFHCKKCGIEMIHVSLDDKRYWEPERPDFSPRSPDWWTLSDKIEGMDAKFVAAFGEYCWDKWDKASDIAAYHFWFNRNLPSNLVAYLRYAYKNGLHQELFKVNCIYAPAYEEACMNCGDNCPLIEEMPNDCEGTIDTPLGKAVREVEP